MADAIAAPWMTRKKSVRFSRIGQIWKVGVQEGCGRLVIKAADEFQIENKINHIIPLYTAEGHLAA
jgi:hypothetical protein